MQWPKHAFLRLSMNHQTLHLHDHVEFVQFHCVFNAPLMLSQAPRTTACSIKLGRFFANFCLALGDAARCPGETPAYPGFKSS